MELTNHVWEMRNNRLFTDLKIISGDGEEVFVHKPILAANVSQWKDVLKPSDEEDQVVLAPDFTEVEILQQLQTVYFFNAEDTERAKELRFLGFENIVEVQEEEIYAILPSEPEPLSMLPKEMVLPPVLSSVEELVVKSDKLVVEDRNVKGTVREKATSAASSNSAEVELPEELPNCPPCGLVYNDFEDLERHFLLHLNHKIPHQHKRVFRCPICPHRELFKSRQMFARHMKRYHKAEKCFYCYQILKVGKLSNHSCEKALYTCEPCQKRFNDMEGMVHHKNVAHKYFYCQYCPTYFREEEEKDLHEETCIRQIVHNARKNVNSHPDDVQGDSFECQHCQTVLQSVQLLRNHIRLQHIEKVGSVGGFCLICSVEVKVATSHVNQHLPEKYRRHKCQFCNSRFNERVKKDEHERLRHTKEPVLKCRYCDRMFMDSARRATHHKKCLLNPVKPQISDPALKREPVLDDDGEPVYSCEACEELFEYEDELITHQQINHLENHCKFCMYFFSEVQLKEEHQARCNKIGIRREGGRPYSAKDDVQGDSFECLHCSVVASSVQNLREHMKSKHCQRMGGDLSVLSSSGTAGSKLCLVCQRGFNNWIHIELHIKEQYLRHGCEFCDKRFATKTKRDEHVRVHHTKERTEKCIYCGAGFMESATKAGHQRTCSQNPNRKERVRKRKPEESIEQQQEASPRKAKRRDVVNDQIFALLEGAK